MIIDPFREMGFGGISHPVIDKYSGDWKKVPEDTLIQLLAQNKHPAWDIELSDDLLEYLESFRDKYKIDSIVTEDEKLQLFYGIADKVYQL
tara:strand:- start:94 stop:366 length:273 start_codon:yes stop_codon:yes gene_type:complete